MRIFYSCRCLVAAATVIVCLFPFFFPNRCLQSSSQEELLCRVFCCHFPKSCQEEDISTQMVRLLPICIAALSFVHFKTSRALSFLPKIFSLDHPSWFSHMFFSVFPPGTPGHLQRGLHYGLSLVTTHSSLPSVKTVLKMP